MSKLRFFRPFAMWLFCMAPVLPVGGQAEERYSDGMVRAAVILGILRFTDWPESRDATATLQICSLGRSPAIEAIGNLESLPSIGETSVVHQDKPTANNFGDCHVLLIGSDAFTDVSAWPLGLLLICDECDVALAEQWMINLMRIDNRIQFEVNMDRVLEKKISLGASLLELAARCSAKQNQIRGCDD